MSEFSESYHFSADAVGSDDQLSHALTSAGLSGVLYATSGKWRTFAPFEEVLAEHEHETTAARLSVAIGQPVLEYRFAEDYYWSFSVWKHDNILSMYSCGWGEGDIQIDDTGVNLAALDVFGVARNTHDALRRLLTPDDADADEYLTAAHRFAHTIGLEHFENVGPATLEIDRDDIEREQIHTIIDGTFTDGSTDEAASDHEPANEASISDTYFNPPPIPLTFKTAEVTARHAYDVTYKYVNDHYPGAQLLAIHSANDHLVKEISAIPAQTVTLSAQGAAVNGGTWTLAHVRATDNLFMKVIVFPGEGRMEVSGVAGIKLPQPRTTTNAWIDSSEAVAIAEPHFLATRSAGQQELLDRFSQLLFSHDPFAWHVTYRCRAPLGGFQDFRVTIDALDGRVIGATAVS